MTLVAGESQEHSLLVVKAVTSFACVVASKVAWKKLGVYSEKKTHGCHEIDEILIILSNLIIKCQIIDYNYWGYLKKITCFGSYILCGYYYYNPATYSNIKIPPQKNKTINISKDAFNW